MRIAVIIPAHNEAAALPKVLSDIPKELVDEVVVVDNASTDGTAAAAIGPGVTVITESRMGYGYACLAGIDYLKQKHPEVVVFIDGDYSDFPQEMGDLVKPVIEGNHDLVIGSRALGISEGGSMTIPQRFGNWLATRLMRIFFGAKFTDLGPFRAIRFSKLLELNMTDKTYGWTIEMQLKAVKNGLVYTEIPVSYRKRIGHSKVSGTVRGTVLAGTKILWTIFKYL